MWMWSTLSRRPLFDAEANAPRADRATNIRSEVSGLQDKPVWA
jgi:hypothetical protein